MSIIAIIPAYKKPEQLEKCLKALEENSLAIRETEVIDNNVSNRGFTAAINEGLRKHYVDFAIILNQDCYLAPGAIQAMADFMEAHPKCAIGGIKQLSSQNPDAIIHGGCTEAFPAGRHIVGLKSKGDCSENKRMPWVNGACMIVRCSALLETGLLDENMFLVGSDSDLCYTARARGFEVWYIADAECVHEQGVSSGTEDPELRKIMYKDMLYWKSKWIGTDLFRELSMEVFP